MQNLKNKIDLMESLDDLEKYQGKWKNMSKVKGRLILGKNTYNSEKEAIKGHEIFVDQVSDNKEFIFAETIKCRLSDITYLGAIPYSGGK